MVGSADPDTDEVMMVIGSLLHLLTLFLDVFAILGGTNSDKDLEIIILRQQVRILQRKQKSLPRISTPEKMVLAILMDKFKQSTGHARKRLQTVMLIFNPDTVLSWHRELVRRKWTFKRKANPGRPKISSELEALIVGNWQKRIHAGVMTKFTVSCSSLALAFVNLQL